MDCRGLLVKPNLREREGCGWRKKKEGGGFEQTVQREWEGVGVKNK
jgi:hypothetical protein